MSSHAPRSRRSVRAESPSPWRLSDEEVESALRTGERARELESYFGEERYAELRQLASLASRRELRGKRPRVLILPGIMGSTIGLRGTLFHDVLWIDPLEIVAGELRKLALGRTPSRYEALGALALVYLKLKLTLQIEGFDADYFPYDWRHSLRELGERLARHVAEEEEGPVQLVAHSMGGLVARAAMRSRPAAMKKVARLVMLGTPNFGSFMPVQALRGTHDLVHKLALFDLRADPAEFASRVLHTLPGLHQMLPAPSKWSGTDLYDAEKWPALGLRPRQALLDEAAGWQQELAPADGRFFLVAGVNQTTVTDLSLPANGTEFEYTSTDEGDGTVPLAFVELPGAKTFYVAESHGSLPNNGSVARAVCDLLESGASDALPARRPEARRRAAPLRRTDADLAGPPYGGRSREQLQQRDLRLLLEEVASPESREDAAAPRPLAAAAAAPSRSGVVVGRRRQRRIDVKLALGSLGEADAEAHLVGVFENVDPGGAAAALDAQLGGAIRDLVERRMLSGRSGEVFLLPARRLRLPTEHVVFAGLGPPEFYGEATQQLAAENAMRALLRARIDDCATVLFGSRPGPAPARSLENLMTGFLRALHDADPGRCFRSLTLCELDPEKFAEMRSELYRLAATDLFADTEITIDEVELPDALPRSHAARGLGGGTEPVYLLVRQETKRNGTFGLRASVLTPGGKATVISAEQDVSRAELDAQLEQIERKSFSFGRLPAFGAELAELVLPEAIQEALAAFAKAHVVVVHDEGASRIPWETAAVNGRVLAGGLGLSRRYVAQDLAPAKWLEQRVFGPTLDVLLVVDPTEDLPGARAEGERLRKLFGAQSRLRIHTLEGPQATRSKLRDAFHSGEWDVVHYAGHAHFDALHPARSGILCHGEEVLSGADLAALSNLPALVFFNACEAGRIRSARAPARGKEPRNIGQRIQRNVSFAEAFLRGGVASYVGTYWPVGDEAATAFAATFYEGLLGGRAVGDALAAAREELRARQLVDWADYIHFGSHDFVVKAPPSAGPA